MLMLLMMIIEDESAAKAIKQKCWHAAALAAR